MDEDDHEDDLSGSSLSDLDDDYFSSDGGASGGGDSDGQQVEQGRRKKQRTKPITVWQDHVHAAFLRVIKLLPKMNASRYPVGDRLLSRNAMIGEYIRRQTGETRTMKQVRHHHSQARDDYKGDRAVRRALIGHAVPKAQLNAMDFDALLGPDKHPDVKPPPPEVYAKKRRARRRKMPASGAMGGPKNVQPQFEPTFSDSAALASSSTGCIDSNSARPAISPILGYGSSTSSRPVSSSSAHEPLLLAQPFSFSTLSPAPPPIFPMHTSHPFLPDLTAFLTSFHPSRDHSPTARALLALGIDSPAALVLLVALEPSSLELLYTHLRKAVGLTPLDVAWLKKVVGAARDECARGE